MDTDCEKLEYTTRSENVQGAIKDFKIISLDLIIKNFLNLNQLLVQMVKNANIIAVSTSIGRINDVRIVDIGYEYSSDKTLSPEAFISPVVNIDNLDIIENVNIISGGANYINAPNLIVFNPVRNVVVDNSSLQPIAPNQTISDVKVIAPVNWIRFIKS